MQITVNSYDDLNVFAADPTKSELFWGVGTEPTPGTGHPLEDFKSLFSNLKQQFPLTLTAFPHCLTTEGLDAFYDGFMAEAGEDLYQEETPGGFAWNASAPWMCPQVFSPIGEWWNPELTPEDMGRAWARVCLAQVTE